MRALIDTDAVPEVEAFLRRRRERGQDLYDEVWDGVYHVAPAPTGQHGYLVAELTRLLWPPAGARGLCVTGALNVGRHERDFRVPDVAVAVQAELATWNVAVPLVVEVVSPGDESLAKFEFYGAHGVEEIVVVDPATRTVRWTTADRRALVRSAVLDLDTADVIGQIRWP